MTKEALKLALDALENLMYWDNGKPDYDEAREAITAIKEALAQPEQRAQLLFEVDGEMLTASQMIGIELFNFQQATGCDTAAEFLAQPEPPPECQTEAEKTAFAFGWFKAMEAQRKPEQKRPQNCGTGYCSCIECVMEPEPVTKYSDIVSDGGLDPRNTTPPQRTWVGLTRRERFEIEKAMSKYYDYQHQCKTVCLPEFAAAIEDKLKEKNT